MHKDATVCPHCQTEMPPKPEAGPTIWQKKQQEKARREREKEASLRPPADEKWNFPPRT
jgi:hypothetical protein